MFLADDGDLFGFLFVAAFFGLYFLFHLVFGRFKLGTLTGGRRYRRLSTLVRDVSALTKLEGPDAEIDAGWFPKLDSVRFKGKLASGRTARIWFDTEGSGSSQTTYVRFEVEASDEVPDLTVTLETNATKLLKAMGAAPEIEIGHPAFDDRYLLETGTPNRARSALQRMPELRRAINTAFACGSTPRLEFRRSRIRFESTVQALDPHEYPVVLATLDDAARCFDRVKLNVKVLGGERRAVIDRSGRTRCPYCREAIAGDELSLTACESCKTVLHEACWDEHGGCPILGCAGTSREHASQRRRRVR